MGKEQNQPKTHCGKTKELCAARRKKIIKAITEGKTQKQAGIEAGLNPNSAENQVAQILKEPGVQDEIKEIFNKAGFTTQAIAEELALIAFSDLADYVTIDDGGAMQAIPFEEMKKGKSRVVKKIREKTQITENKDGSHIFKNSQVEYELYDKQEALKTAINILGLNAPEKVEVKTDIATAIEAARARLKERK